MVSREQIDAFAGEIAKRFSPEKIILFGSHARGQAYEGSDVDLLVVLDHNTENVEMAVEMRDELRPRFPLDLLVRRPGDVERRVAMNDLFIRDIVERGLVLYDGSYTRVG